MIHDQYKVIQVRLDLRLHMEILISNDIYKNLEEKKIVMYAFVIRDVITNNYALSLLLLLTK